VNEQIWWFVARASGMVAAVLIGVTVVWGLLLSTRIVVRKGLPAWLTDLHRGLAGLSVGFVVVHLVALWADSYEEFTVVELLVPFASDWKPTAVAWGVFATWLLAVVQVTSLLQRRMPRRRWHAVHLLSFPLGVFVGVHAMTAGTDASNTWFRWVTLGLAAAVLFLTIYRVLTLGDRSARRPLPASARDANRRRSPAAAAPIDTAPVPTLGAEPGPPAPVLRPPPYRGPAVVAASEPDGALR
jgi:predicted ferric reductase